MEFSDIEIEPNDTEIERYEADGLTIMLVDCGDSAAYLDELRDRELDTIVVPPNVPLSLYNHYEPKCVIYTDGSLAEANEQWRRASMKHFIRKIPLVAIGDSQDEMCNILGNATTGDNNNTDFGIYTFEDWHDDVAERVQYLAVHFNMQDNNYWQTR